MIHRRNMKNMHQGIGMTSQGTRDRLVKRLQDKGIKSEKVLKAIATTARHEFVDEALSSRAYEDTALPIGQRQTISQPWVVARMTEALLECGRRKKFSKWGLALATRQLFWRCWCRESSPWSASRSYSSRPGAVFTNCG